MPLICTLRYLALTWLCIALPLAQGCAPGLQGGNLRPILHLDVERRGAQKRFVTTGIYPDGASLGRLVPAVGATWSPDGTSFAYIDPPLPLVRYSELLILRNLSGEEHTILFSFQTGERLLYGWWGPIWSPDGRKIAVISLKPLSRPLVASVAIIDVSEKKVRALHRLPEETISLPWYMSPPNKFRWSPDGRKILVAWENAVVIDAKTGETEQISAKHVVAEWTPESDGIYYFEIGRSDGFAGCFLKRLGSDSPRELMDEERLAAFGLTRLAFVHGIMTLAPSGVRLAIAGGSPVGLHIYELKEKGPIIVNNPTRSFETREVITITALEWAPDEKSLAFMTMTKDGVRIKLLDLATGEWRTLTTIEGVEFRVPDIDVLAFKVLSWTQ